MSTTMKIADKCFRLLSLWVLRLPEIHLRLESGLAAFGRACEVSGLGSGFSFVFLSSFPNFTPEKWITLAMQCHVTSRYHVTWALEAALIQWFNVQQSKIVTLRAGLCHWLCHIFIGIDHRARVTKAFKF